MSLPFNSEEFFAVFAAYNTAVWPAQFVLVLLAVALVMRVLVSPARARRWVACGLAFLWLWLSLLYHLAFFWSVNPAAPIFAAISLWAAIAFIWGGCVRSGLRFEAGWSVRKSLGLALVLFSLLVYPLLGMWAGHEYPAVPTFGLPCPVTIYTFGIFFMATPTPSRSLVIAPLLWAGIGTFAAFMLHVPQDWSLAVVVVLGFYLLLRGSRSGSDHQSE